MKSPLAGVTRRRFLGFTAGAAAGATLGWNGRRLGSLLADSLLEPPIRPPGGPESHVLSICRMCPGGCGLRVRRIGGRPVKIDGNPLHPISGGRLCPKGQAALQSLYHPDRIPGPLRRVGPKGSLDSFQPATWEEAIEEIAVRLMLLRRQGRPESLVLLRGTARGIDAGLMSRFLGAFGSPNDVQLARGDEAVSQALYLTQGTRTVPAYDLQSAEYVLSFGGALLEEWNAPVYTMRAWGAFRQGREGRRGRLVQAEPRFSMTAAAADEWVPIRPGTEGVLAMGVAAALVAEELYDRDFVLNRTHHFEDERLEDGSTVEGLRTLLLREFRLESVAQETGLSVNRILRLAREFAAARPGVAIGPRRGTLLPGRLFDHLAAHLLNALVGNVDGPGGVLSPEVVAVPAWPELPADPVAEAGRARPRLDGTSGDDAPLLESDPEGLARGIRTKSPYEAGALFLVDADPLFSSMAPEVFATAVEDVTLVVSFTALPNDSALRADWILPPTHFLESWDLDDAPAGVPFVSASLSAPVLSKPHHDVRPLGEVVLDLARRIGGPVAEAFPWSKPTELIRAQADGLFELRRGASMGTAFDEAWVRMMERAGWWAPGYRTPQELWARMQESGGWWDPFYDHWNWNRVFQTPSGRFELRPRELGELARKRRARPHDLREERDGVGAAEKSLTLLLFEPLPIAGGSGADLPFLQDIVDPMHDQRWETRVELHPDTAAALDVEDRSWVRVVSSHGWIRARAQVSRRIVPGAAAVPVGLGPRGGRRLELGRGTNPLQLLSHEREPLSGIPDPEATFVRIVPDAGPDAPPAREQEA